MPLVSMNKLLADARSGGYAVCYCESWNLESLQAVVEAAEEMRAPIIVGFNGGFLAHSSRPKPERVAYYAGLSHALPESSTELAFILNETDDLAQIEAGLDRGFNAVMVENHALDPEAYRRLVKQVVRIAHSRQLAVEAQLGRLPNGWEQDPAGGEMTDAMAARKFVEETGIDALGVSIGNVHIQTRGKAAINISALKRIRKQVEIPLVIHGGSGFPSEYASKVIALGVTKFNFGTNLKQVYLAKLREKLALYTEPMNPHPFLGMGGEDDILVAAREAVKQRVKELIRSYGFAGQPLKQQATEIGSQKLEPL
jgi:ketose-bisphosphate aldolase